MKCTAKVELKYINLMLNIFDHPKMIILASKPKGALYSLLWIKLMVLAGKINKNGRIELTDDVPYSSEDLSLIWKCSETDVKEALALFEEMKMITVDHGIITLKNWGRYQHEEAIEKLKKYQESNAERQRRFRGARRKEEKDAANEMQAAEEKKSEEPAPENAASELCEEVHACPEEPMEVSGEKEAPAPQPETCCASHEQKKAAPEHSPEAAAQKAGSTPALTRPAFTTTRKKLADKGTSGLIATLAAYQISPKMADDLIHEFGTQAVENAVLYFRTSVDKRYITNPPAYLIALIRNGAIKKEQSEYIACTNPNCRGGFVVEEKDGHEFAHRCPVCHGKGEILKPAEISPEQSLQFS
jgi:predicted phage replisome organizer